MSKIGGNMEIYFKFKLFVELIALAVAVPLLVYRYLGYKKFQKDVNEDQTHEIQKETSSN